MANQVHCLYCGAKFDEDLPACPDCAAPSHFQQKGFRFGGRRRFLLWFAAFAIATLLVAVWLPR